MKKSTSFALAIAILVVIAAGYFIWDDHTFVRRAITHYTHIQDIRLIYKEQNNHEWYGKVQIDPKDSGRLLALYPWKIGFDKQAVLAGKLDPPYLHNCLNCRYYVDDTGRGLFGYVVFVMGPDAQQLEVYEQFGD